MGAKAYVKLQELTTLHEVLTDTVAEGVVTRSIEAKEMVIRIDLAPFLADEKHFGGPLKLQI